MLLLSLVLFTATATPTLEADAGRPVYSQEIALGVADVAPLYPVPAALVKAVIREESGCDPEAVSRAGAVGLMQVMPFWPERLGMRRYELVHNSPNIRMGCAILRFYLQQEHNDFARALARYNGSVGRRNYSDLVLGRWARWTGADDLGAPPVRHSALNPGRG
jgi:soluble lytic murein transglycosylase-like protein